MPFFLISFYRIYDLLVMSSTLDYGDDNTADTQCSVGFGRLSVFGTSFSLCACINL